MFIVFEGGSGGGKGIQIESLSATLEQMGHRVKSVSVLDDTQLGSEVKRITKAVLHGEFGHKAETLFFLAAIGHVVEKLIRPALEKGFIVVADRYTFSTLAYQGYGGEQNIEQLRSIAQWTVKGLKPDLVIYLDIPVSEGLSRHPETSHFAQLEFRERVRQGYLEMAAADNWVVIDATQEVQQIRQAVLGAVLAHL